MFPRFSVGLYMTLILGLFLLGNPAIQDHAVKSILSLIPSCLDKWTSQGNAMQIQNGPKNPNIPIYSITMSNDIQRKPREMETRFGQNRSNETDFRKFTRNGVKVHGEESKTIRETTTNHM